MGSAKAAVFPVPVCAMPTTSRPASTCGMVCAWIGVGLAYCSSTSARVMGSARPKARKELNAESFMWRDAPVIGTYRSGEFGHPAWSGLSDEFDWMRRVENQAVEFVHATRGWPYLLLVGMRPSISTPVT